MYKYLMHHHKNLRAFLLTFIIIFITSACTTYSDHNTNNTKQNNAQESLLIAPPTVSKLGNKPLPEPRFPVIDTEKTYTLPELINIAQQLNPSTRIAWRQAQQAAVAAGMVESAYLPVISAYVVGGYLHSNRSDSVRLLGHELSLDYKAKVHGAVPALVMQWLLFDFGKRDALHEAAEHMADASRIKFNEVHQAIIAEVSINYFNYNSARKRLKIAQQGMQNAILIEKISIDKERNGLGTKIEVAQARQLKAQARLHEVTTHTAVQNSFHELLGAIGLLPNTSIKVADSTTNPLPKQTDIPTESYLKSAIARRPDVQATQATYKASQAEIESAEANFRPKILLTGFASKRLGSLNFGHLPGISPYSSSHGALLTLSVPIFDGGLRTKQVRQANLRAKTAKDIAQKTEQDALKQMYIASDMLRAALESHTAAAELVEAAQTTYNGALESYREGLTGMTLMTESHNGLLAAQEAQSVAHTAGLVSSVDLAFTMGELNASP